MFNFILKYWLFVIRICKNSENWNKNKNNLSLQSLILLEKHEYLTLSAENKHTNFNIQMLLLKFYVLTSDFWRFSFSVLHQKTWNTVIKEVNLQKYEAESESFYQSLSFRLDGVLQGGNVQELSFNLIKTENLKLDVVKSHTEFYLKPFNLGTLLKCCLNVV